MLLATIAANAFKVMAYKDEYEVARLYTEPFFAAALGKQFSGYRRLSIHLAPPILSPIDPVSGRPKKRKFGPWMLRAMAFLARGKRLRGTWLDPFGHTAESKAERALHDEYLSDMTNGLVGLSHDTIDDMIALARLPREVRGFGPVKEAAMHRYRQACAELRARMAADSPQASPPAIERVGELHG